MMSRRRIMSSVDPQAEENAKKRNEFIRRRRARAVAKGQYESSGAFIGPGLLSRGPLLRKSNEGRKRQRERGSSANSTARDQIFTR